MACACSRAAGCRRSPRHGARPAADHRRRRTWWTPAHVVVAAGFESLDFLPAKVADIDNTYALVTEPLRRSRRASRMPLIWESARPYLYMRSTPDGRLIVGGADVPFKNADGARCAAAAADPAAGGGLSRLFGEDLPPIAGAWGGSFASTRDGLPFIGARPACIRALQFALCFGGNGITFSVHAGRNDPRRRRRPRPRTRRRVWICKDTRS